MPKYSNVDVDNWLWIGARQVSAHVVDDATLDNVSNVTNVFRVDNVTKVVNVTRFYSFSLMSLMSCRKTLIVHPTHDPMNTNITCLTTLCCEFNSHTGSSPHD